MTIRSSWAVNDAINVQEARVAVASLLTPGMRTGSILDKRIARAGFRPGYGGDAPGRVTATGPDLITVAPFQLFLPGRREGESEGVYIITSDHDHNLLAGLAAVPADAYLSRKDICIVRQSDPYYEDGDAEAHIEVITGFPADNPLPRLSAIPPGDYFILGMWTIPAGVSSMLDPRVKFEEFPDRYTVGLGGIIPIPDTTSRYLLEDSGYSGMTVYNRETKSLETLDKNTIDPATGQTVAKWNRVLADSPVRPVDSPSSAGADVKVVGTLYKYNNDLYMYDGSTSGLMVRLTWNDAVDQAAWKAIPLARDVYHYAADQVPMVRKIGTNIAQLRGIPIRKDGTGKQIDWTNKTKIGTLPEPFRPKVAQNFLVTGEFSSEVSTTAAKISVLAKTGEVWFWTPSKYHPSWVSLDGVIIYLDS